MAKDMADYADLWDLVPMGSKVEFHSDLEFTTKADEVVLMDEADQMILLRPERFQKFSGKAKLIALSATSDLGDPEGTEGAVLKELGFQLYRTMIFRDDRGDRPIQWEDVQMNTNEEKLEFLREELKKRSVIMYCETAFIEYIGGHLEYTLVDMSLDMVELRRLEEKDGETYRLILSDDHTILSRGLDFRSSMLGLTFVQAKAAPDHRTLA